MKIYILTDEPYHDNELIYGVFSTLELAQAAHRKCKNSSVIGEFELDEITKNGIDYDSSSQLPFNSKDAEVSQ